MEGAVNKRVRDLITYLQYSETRFAKEIGVRQSVINTMFKRGTEPSIKLVTSILNTFVFVSADWLLTGQGEMIKSDSKDKANENNSPLELNTINLNDMESLMSMLKEALSDLRKEREYVHKYHEEIVALKNEVEGLKVQLSEKDDIINHLRKGEMDYGKAMVN